MQTETIYILLVNEGTPVWRNLLGYQLSLKLRSKGNLALNGYLERSLVTLRLVQ
jgi:hypothetical protein